MLAWVTLHEPSTAQQLNLAMFALLALLAATAFLGPYVIVVAELGLHLPLRLLGRTTGRLASAESGPGRAAWPPPSSLSRCRLPSPGP